MTSQAVPSLLPTRARRGAVDDEPDRVVVDRLVSGDRPAMFTSNELAAALARLDDGTHSASELARHLGVASRTVVRHRAIRRDRDGNAESTRRVRPMYVVGIDPAARGRTAQRPRFGITRAERDYSGEVYS